LRQIFNEMLTRYRQQDFSGAEEAIARCRALGDDFGLGHLFEIYTERIDGFRKDPPPADWNGVFHLYTK
jgi:adenylate cyclase